MTLAANGALTALTGLRLGVGVAGWIAPRVTARAFGIETLVNPALPYALRLFATRDALLGWLQLEFTGEELDRLLALGIAVDVADGIAALAAGRRRDIAWRAALPAAGIAFGAAWLGVIARRER